MLAYVGLGFLAVIISNNAGTTMTAVAAPAVNSTASDERFVTGNAEPYFTDVDPQDGYTAFIRENDIVVRVYPAIRAKGDVCGFRVSRVYHMAFVDELGVDDSSAARAAKDRSGRSGRSQITDNNSNAVDADDSAKTGDDDSDDEDDGAVEDDGNSVPFNVVVDDSYTNPRERIVQARIEARIRPNCEHKRNYKFDIVAVACRPPKAHPKDHHHGRSRFSPPAKVQVVVEDVNEHAPKFLQSSYDVAVVEDQLYDSVLRVHAEDDDCSPEFNTISAYKILEQNVPFAIDNAGNIRNTQPLHYQQRHNWILTVVAFDSAMKRSDEAAVNVRVKRQCNMGWSFRHADSSKIVNTSSGTDRKVHIVYEPRSGPKPVAPEAKLDVCEGPAGQYALPHDRDRSGNTRKCEKIDTIEARLTLRNDHVGHGCDVYADSKALRSSCSGSTDIVELLPHPDTERNWTSSLPRDHSVYNADSMFAFDGRTTFATVPNDAVAERPRKNFTVTFWMKHQGEQQVHAGRKETILCDSDDHGRSRHHFSVFVRNCKLMMLLRHEAKQGENMKTFRPSEWRWHAPEVCDDKWHHYGISVQFPDVKLLIDGELRTDVQVLDDWPLHPIPTSGKPTRLAVGACWQGGLDTMEQFFRGQLSQLNLLVGRAEHENVVQCLRKCPESLDFPRLEDLAEGMQLRYSRDMRKVTITGHAANEVDDIVRDIAFVNTRTNPTPGFRYIDLETILQCTNSGPDGGVSQSPQKISIVLEPVQIEVEIPGSATLEISASALVTPLVKFSGPSEIEVRTSDIRRGFAVLQNLVLTVSSNVVDGEDQSALKSLAKSETLLSHCSITVHPAFDPNNEELLIVPDVQQKYAGAGGVAVHADDETLTLDGVANVANYLALLRNLMYYSTAKVIVAREFALECVAPADAISPPPPPPSAINQNSKMDKTYKVKVNPTENDPTKIQVQDTGDFAMHTSVHDMPDTSLQAAYLRQEVLQVPFQSRLLDFGLNTFTDGGRDASMAASLTFGSLSAGKSFMIVVAVLGVGLISSLIVFGIIKLGHIRRRRHPHSLHDVDNQEMQWDDAGLTITVNPLQNRQQHDLELEDMTDGGGAGTYPVDDDDADEDEEDDDDEGCDIDEDESETLNLNHLHHAAKTPVAPPTPTTRNGYTQCASSNANTSVIPPTACAVDDDENEADVMFSKHEAGVQKRITNSSISPSPSAFPTHRAMKKPNSLFLGSSSGGGRRRNYMGIHARRSPMNHGKQADTASTRQQLVAAGMMLSPVANIRHHLNNNNNAVAIPPPMRDLEWDDQM